MTLANAGPTTGQPAADHRPTPYTCPACGAVSHQPRDAKERYCARCKAFEDDVRQAVRMRLIAAAEASRDGLWYARGGLQLLTPEQALQFGIALGAVDKLVNLLLDQGAQAWVERFTRDS